MLFPLLEDLPFLARPFSDAEREQAKGIAAEWNIESLEESAPISVVGSGENLNVATDDEMERAASLLGMTVPEVRNRATVTGAIGIGRHPGVVQVTFLAPVSALVHVGLDGYAREQYGLCTGSERTPAGNSPARAGVIPGRDSVRRTT